MNVLVITPIYHIVGRPDLFHDSSAIHYLLKPLSKDNSIFVLNTYCASIRELPKRLLVRRTPKVSPFEYSVDGINVRMYESQFLPKQVYFNPIQCEVLINRIEKLLSELKPSIICVHFPTSYYGVLDKLRTNVPMIGILHKTDVNRISPEKNSEKLAFYLNNTYRCLYARSNAIRTACIEKQVKVSNQIVYSGISIDQFTAVSHIRENIKQIIFVGKLIKRKNVDILIEAFTMYRDAYKNDLKLLIVGNGNCRDILEKKAKKCSDIVFLGEKSREDVIEIMSESDVFIMPSENETLGLVYLEAMATGCITVGTKNEGIDGVIKDGINGFLVNPNIDSVYNTIDKICNLPTSKIRDISKCAISSMSEYSEQKSSENYFSILEKS